MFTSPSTNPFRITIIIGFVFVCLIQSLSAETITVREVIRGYLTAQGGEDRLEKVQSIRIEGTVTQGGSTYRLRQFKKLPNLVRLNISGDNRNLSLGYNGEIAWVKPKNAPQSIPMEPEATEAFIANATLFSQLYVLRDELNSINLLGESTVKGESCYELQLRTREGTEMIYFLGKNDFLERKVVQLVNSAGAVIRNETYFDDFQKIAPLTIPYYIESYSDGELSSTINIKSAKLNAGVFNSYFNPPGGLTSLEKLKGESKDRSSPKTIQRARNIGLNLDGQSDEAKPILSPEPIKLLEDDDEASEFDTSP